jgi:hypothetical protein
VDPVHSVFARGRNFPEEIEMLTERPPLAANGRTPGISWGSLMARRGNRPWRPPVWRDRREWAQRRRGVPDSPTRSSGRPWRSPGWQGTFRRPWSSAPAAGLAHRTEGAGSALGSGRP